MKRTEKKAIFFALLAATLYALNAPVSKLLLEEVPPVMMAGYLYLGAGIGVFLLGKIRNKVSRSEKELPLTQKELPFTIGMIVLDIAAPIFLMAGLVRTTSANASLLNNFEIVATAVIAFFVFQEKIGKRLGIAIILVVLASVILSFEDMGSLSFSAGSILVLAASCCWGLENNCTRMLSAKNPAEIVVLKGIFSGLGSLIIALLCGERYFCVCGIIGAMTLGFVAYGLSIYFYIYAQRWLGAAKTSAYYAVAPFIGVALSSLIFREKPTLQFGIACVIMMAGTYFASTEQS